MESSQPPALRSHAEKFYDDLVDYYDLIFSDWNASMVRQGDALAHVIRERLSDRAASTPRVLDVAAGIGTQALPLAERGFHVVARDLSPEAIARLTREAEIRGVQIDAGVSDMRTVGSTVARHFDAVICCDNSLPHLLTDEDIVVALSQFREVLTDGGLLVCSVRDYDRVERGVKFRHDYGERRRGEQFFRLWQEWGWTNAMHYEVTFIVEELTASGPIERVRTSSKYYAVGIPRLLELSRAAGFASSMRLDHVIYQPLIVARRNR